MNPNLSEPGQELEYVKFTRIEKPRRIFFYKLKDTDGDVIEDSPLIACYEQEAGMFGQFHKLLGVGDGMAYYNHMKNAKVMELCSLCGGAKMVEQAVNTDAGVKMVKSACTKCNGLGTAQRTLRPGMVISVTDSKRILQEAFDAEWEASDKSKKIRPKYENRAFDSTVLLHENSEEITKSFGRQSQPKPGLPGGE